MRKVLLLVILVCLSLVGFYQNTLAEGTHSGVIYEASPSCQMLHIFPKDYNQHIIPLKFSVLADSNITFHYRWKLSDIDSSSTTLIGGDSPSVTIPASSIPTNAKVLVEVFRIDEDGKECQSDYFLWTIYRTRFMPPYTSDYNETYGYVFTKKEVDTGVATITPPGLPFSSITYSGVTTEYSFPDKYKDISTQTYIGGGKILVSSINRNTRITMNGSYSATVFDGYGNLQNTTVYRTVGYSGILREESFDDVFSPQENDPYVMPGSYEFSVNVNEPDNILWTINGVNVQKSGTSFGYTLQKGSNVVIGCTVEKYFVDASSGTDEYYYRKISSRSWGYSAIIERSVAAISYSRCVVPYDLGNGICLDLKTGDAKIHQTDLNLPGRDGLDLVLTRIFSGRANFDQWYDENTN
jgi:hypothetical protein